MKWKTQGLSVGDLFTNSSTWTHTFDAIRKVYCAQIFALAALRLYRHVLASAICFGVQIDATDLVC